MAYKLFMYSDKLRRHRRFHRLGLCTAGIVMAMGIALIAAAVARLNLLEESRGHDLAFALGSALVVLGIVSVASYAVVRVIEWASRR